MMAIKQFLCVIAVTLLAVLGMCQGAPNTEVKAHSLHFHNKTSADDNTGVAKNCGSVPFKLTWTPKVLHPTGSVNVHVQYSLPHDFDGGIISANLSFHGDPQPFIGVNQKMDCTDVKQYFPFCPISKGMFFNRDQKVRDLHKVATFPGTYDLIARLTNTKGEEMICVQMTVEIANV